MVTFLLRFLPESRIVRGYMKRGVVFGFMYYMATGYGVPRGFDKHFRTWEMWEKEYARRGYKPVELNRFIKASLGNKKVDHFVRRLKASGRLLLHAKTFRERNLSTMPQSLIDLSRVMAGEAQIVFAR